MLRKIITLGLIGSCFCQYNEEEHLQPRQSFDGQYYKAPPQILSHKQSLNHDGSFKYAFSSENGLLQGESIAPDGSRTGAYAYVDPSGKKISVKYIAGKEGFKILEGDHIPKPHPLLAAANEQPPGYQRFQPPSDIRPVYDNYRPEITKSLGHYKTEPSKPAYIPYRSTPTPLTAPIYRKSPQYTQFEPKPYQQQFAQESTNEVQPYQLPARYNEPKEPEYNDEPGKPNSFGTGYGFEFSG